MQNHGVSSVHFSHSVMSDSLWLHGLQHTRPTYPSPTPEVYPNSGPLSSWCHPTISSSVILFSCLQPFPASESFPMSWLFASDGQSIGASASTSVLPMNTQDWSPLGWTNWISLQSKGLSRIFSNTTVQKQQFLSLGWGCTFSKKSHWLYFFSDQTWALMLWNYSSLPSNLFAKLSGCFFL